MRMKKAFTLAELPEVGQYKSKRVAFTLAEVLITLGIIGVVAAMTIPTLMKNYQTKIRDVQFKKVYSTLNQAVLAVQADYGYIPSCYYGNGTTVLSNTGNGVGCKQFYNDLLTKLKITKTCSRGVQNNCMPSYAGLDTVKKDLYVESHKNDADFDEEYWTQKAENDSAGCAYYKKYYIDRKTSYTLADGAILFIYDVGMPIIAVDINGMSGPNKWGYDLFSFGLTYNGKIFRYTGGNNCAFAETGGIITQDLIKKLYGQQ